jgi:dipeptidyl aminopeptidase/acylaminoacyl peptidase
VGTTHSLAWSRDGKQLAYSFLDQSGYSISLWSVDAGHVRTYPLRGEGLSALDWSSDGKRLAAVRWTPMSLPEDHATHSDMPAPTIKVVRRLRYKQDGVGWVHDRYTQIWVLELETGDLLRITHSEMDYSSPKWSLRGDKLAFVGMAREQNVPLGYGQIFVCDFPNGAPRRLLPDWQGTALSPVWGSDDRYIAFAGHNSPPPVNRRNFWQPYLADVAAGTAKKLGDDLVDEVGNYAVADQRKGLANVTVKWAAGDKYVYFLLTEKGTTNLYRIDTDGRYEKLVSGNSCGGFMTNWIVGHTNRFAAAVTQRSIDP